MYEIYINQGQGKVVVKTMHSLHDAVKYTNDHKGEGVFAIKCPSGKWYEWN
jgi:hypothetical protein